MENQWFFEFSVHIEGENFLGESVNAERKIRIPLFATDASDAERQAKIAAENFTVASKKIDWKHFKQYCADICYEDGLSFSNFCIVFKKTLEICIPPIIGGP